MHSLSRLTKVAVIVGFTLAALWVPETALAQTTVFGGVNDDGDWVAGLRGEMSINPRFAIDWYTSYSPNEAFHTVTLSPSLLVYLVPRQPFLPYVFAGYGLVGSIFKEDPGPGAGTLIGRSIHYGVGGKYYFTDSVAFRLEARWLNIDRDSFRSRDDMQFGSATVPHFTFGLTFGFKYR